MNAIAPSPATSPITTPRTSHFRRYPARRSRDDVQARKAFSCISAALEPIRPGAQLTATRSPRTLIRYRDQNGDDWADIIDFLTMYPEARGGL